MSRADDVATTLTTLQAGDRVKHKNGGRKGYITPVRGMELSDGTWVVVSWADSVWNKWCSTKDLELDTDE